MIVSIAYASLIFYPFILLKLANGDCIWYGECNTDHLERTQNCLYNGTAMNLTSGNARKLLLNWCPNMAGFDSTCCDARQLTTMDRRLPMIESLIGRCPSCFRSFLNLFCEMTCSPRQRTFINVTSVGKNKKGEIYVTGVDLYVSSESLNGIFESCKTVAYPSGQLALDVMCGGWGAHRCTSSRWFGFMGEMSDKNPHVPFGINYIATNSQYVGPFQPLQSVVIPCHAPANNESAACSCMDCKKSCPPPFEWGKEEDLSLYGYNIYSLSGILFLAITCALVACANAVGYCGSEELGDEGKKSGESLSDVSNYPYPMNGRGKREPDAQYDSETSTFLEKKFEAIGTACATYPIWTLVVACCVVGLLSRGIFHLKLTTNPVDLWSATDSQCRSEREYYNRHFQPFYRIQQIIISSVGLPDVTRNTVDGEMTYGPVFHKHFLLAVKKLQDQILNIGQPTGGLQNICLAPLMPANKNASSPKHCVVQSILGFYQNSEKKLNATFNSANGYTDYLDHFKICSENNMNPSCFGEYGGPIDPAVVVGGFLRENESLSNTSGYERATSLLITIPINNYNDEKLLSNALLWEQRFLSFVKNWTENEMPSFMNVSYYSERSIEDELDRASKSDISVIVISYVIMFIYISLSLGRIRSLATFLMDSKITLGIGGVVIVIASVISSLGFYAIIEVPATLIVIEVIPFLVLAVGVDNIFILVQRHQRTIPKPDETNEQHIGRVLGKVGPSILLTTLSESCCFFLGSLSDMPAVKAFALFAGMALVMDFLLQITCFVSLMALDTRRAKVSRYDLFCCVKKSCNGGRDERTRHRGLLYNLFEEEFEPFILHSVTRPLVILLFAVWLCCSIMVLPNVQLGLEQSLAIPEDSYVYKYFQDLNKYLSVGPPVYFVVKDGADMSDYAVQNTLCGGQRCNADSVTNMIYSASKSSNVTYIARRASSWIDDYLDYCTIPGCCRQSVDDSSFCPHTQFQCMPCPISINASTNRPTPQSFNKYLSFFLSDNPDAFCSKAGHAAYSQSVKYKNVSDLVEIKASSFMAFHTVLKSSKDYYMALKQARRLANNMTDMLRRRLGDDKNIAVFPYSIFYVFYEQYLTIWPDTIRSVLISLLAIFAVTLALTRVDVISSLIIVSTIAMIVVNLGGLMYYFDVQLNAASLVNLVMAVGISVEFVGHMVYSFNASAESTRIERASQTLIDTGSSVFSGITLTKVIGVMILAFSKSQIFRVLYFQMYLGIVLVGAFHGLIFLPVLLSYIGSMKRRFPYEGIPLDEGKK